MTDDNGIHRVQVVDYNTLKNALSGVISVDQALAHPQTIPFIGSEKGAQAYLKAHRQAYNTDKIGVWHSDDFDPKTPRARLLLFGNNDINGLFGDDILNDYSGRVLGVAPKTYRE